MTLLWNHPRNTADGAAVGRIVFPIRATTLRSLGCRGTQDCRRADWGSAVAEGEDGVRCWSRDKGPNFVVEGAQSVLEGGQNIGEGGWNTVEGVGWDAAKVGLEGHRCVVVGGLGAVRECVNIGEGGQNVGEEGRQYAGMGDRNIAEESLGVVKGDLYIC